MSLIPWRNKGETGIAPARTISRMRDDFDSLLRRFWNDPWSLTDFSGESMLGAPRMDMSETDDDVTLRFELPGVKAEEVDISISGNVLTLRGEKSDSREEKCSDCTYSERSFGSFSRSVQIPTAVNPDSVVATYNDGVLTVRLAKSPEAKPKKITVRRA
jgi:HSP20 family protein